MPSTTRTHSAKLTPRSAFDWFFRSRETGHLAIIQVPNAPLAIFIAATLARVVLHPSGTVGVVVSVVAAVSLLWWSIDEIVRGESPFRRVLGALVLLGMGANLVLR